MLIHREFKMDPESFHPGRFYSKPEQKYYMQDKRQYVGNSMYWWAKNARGYTCDIRNAHVFTLEEAKKHSCRETDILWPKTYIDERISYHIDIQHCDPEVANTINMSEAGDKQTVKPIWNLVNESKHILYNKPSE